MSQDAAINTYPAWLGSPTGAMESVPWVAGTFGIPGCGKTLDQIRLLPDAVWYGEDRNFRTPAVLLNWLPKEMRYRQYDLESLQEAILKDFPGEKNPKGYRGIGIDEINTIIARQVIKERGAAKNTWKAYAAVNSKLQGLLDVLGRIRVNVAWNAHEDKPKWEKNEKGEKVAFEREGGPDAPGQSLEILCKHADLALRLGADPLRGGEHSVSYFSGMSGDDLRYLSKSRITWASRTPPNLSEVLRAAGYRVPRPAAWDGFMEPRVEWAATNGHAGRNSLAAQMLAENVPQPVIYWIVSDAIAREEIRAAQDFKERLRKMGVIV